MCTAITYKTKDFYFGRNLDHMESYGEEVVITPRNYPFRFRKEGEMDCHYAMIGTACVREDQALYYDAVNETGLCMAGLNFVGNAVYAQPEPDRTNIAQFELIPWLLGRCASVQQARTELSRLNLTGTPFSAALPAAQLHWLIADKTGSIVVESTAAGLHIYDDPVGVLTNNPPFPQQLFALNNYRALSPRTPAVAFADGLDLPVYSRGLGGLGLPGDLSSQSRFVRVAFVRMNAKSGSGEAESVNQFFHILHSVEQQRGCCELDGGKYEITLYTSCCNADRGIYYYTTYGNHQITAVDMHRENLDGDRLVRYPLVQGEQIALQN